MKTSRSIAWFVWIVASIFYAYQYVLRVMPSIMLNDIMQQFHIDAAIFGQFSGVYYMGYSLMHLPIGIMLDRFGPKKVMSACIALTVLGLLPILFATDWIYPVIGRVLIGAGSSAAILGIFKIIRMTFKEEKFARMLSISVTIGLLGAIYGGGPVSYMCKTLGYHMVIQIFAFVGIALAAATYFIVPEMKEEPQGTVLSDIREVFSNTKVVASCLCAGLMVGVLEGFADVWGAAFLHKVYGFDDATSSYLPSVIFIGMCVGAPLLSLIAEKTSYLGSIIGAGVIMTVTFFALMAQVLTLTSITVLFALVGMCSAYQILAIYKASTYVHERVAGLTTAVANMIIMIFGYGLHTIIGFVINAYGGTGVSQAFVCGISVIPIATVIGVLGFLGLAIQETRKKEKGIRSS